MLNKSGGKLSTPKRISACHPTANGEYDAVIIGGGIVGTSAAFFLAKAGKRVALVEKGRVAGEQSGRNWGAVRVQGRDRSEIPLMIDCLEIWKNLEAELGESVGWHQKGQMLVAYDEKHLAQLEALMPTNREFGVSSRILTRSEIHEFLPHYNCKTCLGAMFNPQDGCAEPELAAPALARGAKRLGADVFDFCAARKIETTNGRVSGVETEVGFLKAESVVVASGAWTGRLLKQVGMHHPSLWIRGSVARTAPLAIDMRKLVVWGATAYRQRDDGRVNIAVSEDGLHDLMIDSLKFGHKFLPLALKNRKLLRFKVGRPLVQSMMGEFSDFTTHRTLDPKPDWQGLNQAAASFLQEYPSAGSINYERGWAGYIDYMPDELPVIDMCSKPDGLAVAAGLSGNGFGLGPIVGKTLSDLIITGHSKYDLKSFSSDRFQ